MSTTRQKDYNETNVFDEGCARIKYLFEAFDNVIVNFSAGKDSTCVLNMTLKVAKELNRSFEINFFDEEAVHPPTIEYALRTYEKAKEWGIKFNWYCLQFKHRNACSNEEPFWYCWDKTKADLWVREMPKIDNLITEHPKFEKGMSFQIFSSLLPERSSGLTVILTGVRTQESFRRMKAVSTKKNDNYIARNGHVSHAHPIYDMSSEDVWLCVHKFGWDYNRSYDIMNKTKMFNGFLSQRVCPPFGEEPLRGLWMYAECWPDMWHKMLARVDGVATAWRYANTEIYGYGKQNKPENLTYKEWCEVILESYDSVDIIAVKKNVNSIIKRHYDKTTDQIPDSEHHPLTGTSWIFICKLITKGDFKGRTAPTLEGNAITAQKKLGINSFNEAVMRFGTNDYKAKHFKSKQK
jgi:predicted phosphoadenosine phosphosulfate sulfurtransferase